MLEEPGMVWDVGAEMGLEEVFVLQQVLKLQSHLCAWVSSCKGKGVCAAHLDKLHHCGFACSFSVSLKSI